MKEISEDTLENDLQNSFEFAIHFMYTKKGVDLYMKIAEFYYTHYNIFTYILVQIPISMVIVIDSIIDFIERKNK